MSEKLRVDYVAVQEIIQNIMTYESDVESKYGDMTTAVESLVNNGYMEAEAATAYVDEFKQMLGPDVEDLAEMLGTFHTQLTQICQNFADADAKIAGMLF
ncbi:MAG: WXG100 family type VII secretion target [Clostridium sp.]|nr:WXG100 family type VII secretion target [Clostridium sp.]MCM1170746.1 WXG100 family type VII secretion target [Clostridium sp.]MCM1207619.1 WXG100 family type VII secretion target [Ruminococcus sp.]